MIINELAPPHRPSSRSRVSTDRGRSARGKTALGTLLSLVFLLTGPTAALAQQQQHGVPLVIAAGSAQQGFIRIINRSDRPGTVCIDAIDDAGERFGPAELSLGAMATAHLNSKDLEDGNASKGLPLGVGDGEGDWRLVLTTDLVIEPLAYIRTSDGFLTSVHDVVQPEAVIGFGGTEFDDLIRYRVPFINPGSNTKQVSRLRLINPSSTEVVVTIRGQDDAGASPPGGDVRVTLEADAARTLTAQALEQGGPGLEGRLGDGAGKWQLLVSAQDTSPGLSPFRPLQVVNLLHSRGTGNLANLSSIGPGNDPSRGGDGADWVTGGGGDDILDPGDNDGIGDIVLGSAGTDTILYSDSGPNAWQNLDYSGLGTGISATIDGVRNRATVNKGSAGTDTIVDVANPLNAGAFLMAGSHFDDSLVLTLDAEQWMGVRGNAGNDTIDIRSGRVQINYRSSTDGVDVDLAAGRASNNGFGGTDTIIGDVHELIGGSGNDTIRGTDGGDRLDGRAGNDVLEPRDNDASSTDSVFASAGNDRIVYSDSTYGNQMLYYSRPWRAARTALDESGIVVTLDGAANRATIRKGAAGTDTIVDISNPLDAGWTTGGFGLVGTKGDDVFNLSLDREQWMQVRGGPGNDRFNLRTHRWVSEALQSSIIRIDYSYQDATGGIDIDLRAGRARDDGFGDADTFAFNDGTFQLRGTKFSDTIRGTDNDDTFIGRGGNDVIDGRGGSDELRFDRSGAGAVVVDLQAGTAKGTWDGDAFSYRISNIESVRGSRSGDDRLYGNNSYNRLRGYGGDDILDGRGGENRFEGGDGRDTFVIGFSRHGNYQRIDDFTDGEDRIDLNAWGIPSHSALMAVVDQHVDGTGIWIDLTRFAVGGTGYYGVHLYGYFDIASLDASDFLL